MQIEELYTKFLSKKIPNYFSINDVDRIYKEKYDIKELSIEDFSDLKEDLYVDYANIVKCYQIDNENVLDNLYSEEEKESKQKFYEFLLENYPNEDFKLKDQKIINIILESKDGIRISGYTIQGGCSFISSELIVFKGLDKEEKNLDNRKFINYLNALNETGFL